MSSIDAMGSDGQSIDLDSAPATYTYNSDGTVATDTVVWVGNTYVQTYTYIASQLTSVSGWVKQ